MSVFRNSIAPILSLAGLVAIALPVPAAAESELSATWEGGPSNGYAEVSPSIDILSLGPSSIAFVPAGTYNYYDVHEHGGTTDVASPGLSAGLEYQYSDDALSFDVGPSLQTIWQDRKAKGGQKAPTITATISGWSANSDLSYQFSEATSFDVSGSYEQTDRYYTLRPDFQERIAHVATLSWRIGPEAVFQGNNQFQQTGGGLVTEFDFDATGTAFQFRAGYQQAIFSDHTHQDRPYAGVALTQRL